ncbi:unnamed protein product [Nippostrongylus brasiliensis]|uniref:Brain protein I3 n=1 Tax=Nippostrongylus brasiliensis TaxID=27835 RepID=A0A0N4XEL2_NIPBR|nr:unnamed protein product [Nippostrongylus brasiliensis]
MTAATSSSVTSCPDCRVATVQWRNTLSGLLYAVLCFPCGIYCCLQRRQLHCTRCDCDVSAAIRSEIHLPSGYFCNIFLFLFYFS